MTSQEVYVLIIWIVVLTICSLGCYRDLKKLNREVKKEALP